MFLCISAQDLFMVAYADGKAGDTVIREANSFDVEGHDHSQDAPYKKHSNTDHRHSCCEQHSSPYLGCQSPSLSYHPNIVPHSMSEIVIAFPEVYLEKFIPPQNFV